MDLCDQILIGICHKKLNWEMNDIDAIARRLCESYVYRPDKWGYDREFVMIALGWMWAKKDYVTGNCYTGMLVTKMQKAYEAVAKENGWNDKPKGEKHAK